MPSKQAKSRINEQGVRVDVSTGQPIQQSTGSQRQSLREQRNVDNVFTPEALQEQQGFNLTLPEIDTQTTGEVARMESQAQSQQDRFTRDLEVKAENAKSKEEDSFNRLLQETLDTSTQSQLEDRAFSQEGGVDDIQVELDDINSQIRAEQQALRRQVEQIQSGAGTATQAQRNVAVSEAQRQSLRKQADLAVIQQSVQGRFDSAKTIADRAVKAQVDAQQKKIDILGLIYDRHSDLFDKAETRAFQTAQADRERKLDEQARDLQQISDLSINALSNGAPTSIASQMRSATTPQEAMEIGGQYVDRLDRLYRSAQIRKIGLESIQQQSLRNDIENGILPEKDIKAIDNSPQGKKLITASDLKLKLSSYQQLVEEYGFEQFGPEKSVLQNAYKELQLAYKEAANLGVLNGPDLDLIEEAIATATPGFFGNSLNVLTFGGGTRKLKANLEQAQKTINSAAQLNLEQLYSRNPDYKKSLYIESMILPFGDELITQEEQAEMDATLNQ